MTPIKIKRMLQAIEKHHCLLVYPIKNRKEPLSLWSALHPRSEMVWEWDAGADGRVADLWHSREVLSRSKEVVYSKWYQNRATFFSKRAFTALLAFLGTARGEITLPHSSQEALESFLMDSPQSTRLIKENLGWQGKMMEGHFNRAMRPLWNGLFIVGYGEVEDSSFPSLNIAATATLFEDLWTESLAMSEEEAERELLKILGQENLFMKYAIKIKNNSRR